jgi:hypothetical protein
MSHHVCWTSFRIPLARRCALQKTYKVLRSWYFLVNEATSSPLAVTDHQLSGTEYVDHLMNWVQAMLDDEAIFPSRIGARTAVIFDEVTRSADRFLSIRCCVPEELSGYRQIDR